MPSAYLLARDHIEQARAILDSEVWHDETVCRLLERLDGKLAELDARLIDVSPLEYPSALARRPARGERRDNAQVHRLPRATR